MKNKVFNNIIKMMIGAAFGSGIVLFGSAVFQQAIEDDPLVRVGTLIIFLGLGFVVHTIIHEAGHLVMGKISGYKTVSFRVFNIIFVKEKGKWVRKKRYIPGTLGQCLMSPPELINGEFPYILYNLGGSLMNFIFSALFLTLYLVFTPISALGSAIFFQLAIIGICIGILNIVPYKMDGVRNDGHNILTLCRSERVRRAFWLLLRINALMTEGYRYRDIPAEQFDILSYGYLSDGDKAEMMYDSIIISIEIYQLNRLIDRHDFKEGKVLAERLLGTIEKMPELCKNELSCELLFIELIGECRKEKIDCLYTKDLQKYIKVTSSYAARQRLIYAYAKLVLDDDVEALKALEMFNKACSLCPNSGEAASERELIHFIDLAANRRKTP